MCPTEYQTYYRRHLPHAHPPGATFFVTCRLANTIPARQMAQLLYDARLAEDELTALTDGAQREQHAYTVHRRLFAKWDGYLHAADAGPKWLAEPEVAQLVTNSLHHGDRSTYDLLCHCIMPNHLHVVFTPLPDAEAHYPSVAKTLQSLKGYTAFKGNAILQRAGPFWQHESYDHWARDDAELARIVAYVINNPVKANLVPHWQDWPWTYTKYSPR